MRCRRLTRVTPKSRSALEAFELDAGGGGDYKRTPVKDVQERSMNIAQPAADSIARRSRSFEPITEREAESALALLEDSLYAPRNVLIFLLAYELAMSARQIAGTTWEQLLERGTKQIRASLDVYPLYPNARRPKQKPVSLRLAAAISAHSAEYGTPLTGHVFLSRSGVTLAPQSVDQVFKYWFQRCGLGRKSIVSVQRLSLARAAKAKLTSYPARRRAAAESSPEGVPQAPSLAPEQAAAAKVNSMRDNTDTQFAGRRRPLGVEPVFGDFVRGATRTSTETLAKRRPSTRAAASGAR